MKIYNISLGIINNSNTHIPIMFYNSMNETKYHIVYTKYIKGETEYI